MLNLFHICLINDYFYVYLLWEYTLGRHAGTPLHHAAKRGLDQTVKVLLARGGMSYYSYG